MKNIYPLFLSAHFAVLALLLFGYQGIVQSQPIFFNPITGTNPNTSDPYTTGQTVNANLTVSGIGRGTGINGTNANDRYNANGWNTTNLDLDAYFEWVITPNAGFQIDFVSLVYTGQRSGTGPNSFALRSSADGFTSNIGAPTATGATITLSAAAYQGVTSAITFRLYGWATTNSGGTFSVNDFTFNGTVAPIPMVSIETIDADAAEAGPATGTFRISRTGSTTAALEVDYTIGGSASSADYAPMLSGTVTIPAGESFTDLTITPIDDDLVEGTETLTLTLVDGAAYDLSADVSATVNIEDNDFAYLTVSPSSATVNEGAGVYTSNIRLLIDSSPAGGTLQDAVTVQLVGVELSATFDDFTLITTSVTFPAGSGNGATQPFEVTIVDDNLVEGNEFFDVAMVQTGYTGVPSIVQDNQVIPGFCNGNNNDCRNRQTIRITDNDLPDYTITTTGNAIVITDLAGNGETLDVTENGANIRFNAAGRIYTINGGAGLSFPADVPLAGAASITINAAGGDDIIDVGAFTANLPDLTINGGTGDDVVNFNGDITFAADANLDVDLQNDDAAPGIDQVVVAMNTNLVLSGTGAATIRVSRNVELKSDASIKTEDGDLLIEANQQAVPTAENFIGVWLFTAMVGSTGSGSVTVMGTGGAAGTNNYGVHVDAGSEISSGGIGTVTVMGRGGVAGNFNFGVWVSVASSKITSGGGDVMVMGQGGGTGTSRGNYGVHVLLSGEITAGVDGKVIVMGQGGDAAGDGNLGVFLSNLTFGSASSSAKITSSGGNVEVTGIGGGNGASSNNDGVRIANDSEISSGGMGTVTVSGTGGATTGEANRGVYLSANGSEITSSAGAVEVTGTGNNGAADILMVSGGMITSTSASAGITLHSTTNGTFPNTAGTDVSTTAQTTTFGTGSKLNIDIDGLTANTEYQQLGVVGAIDLNGAELTFAGSTHTPAIGETFTIVDNDGVDAIIGTFQGLPERAVITDFLGSSLEAFITYTGGDGNDVVLTVIENNYVITTTAGALVITEATDNGETLEVTDNGNDIRFNAADRFFRLNGGPTTAMPADVPLPGITSITINTEAGNDIINFGAFTAALPSLTINGGTGDDAVNFNGDITFAANAHLDVDMQNDDATPGLDQVTIAANANLILSGTGAATVKVSRNVTINSGGSIETANGDLTVEANQQAAPTTGSFFGILLNGATITTSGTGHLFLAGKGGNTSSSTGIRLINSSTIQSTATANGGTINLNGTGQPAGNTHAVFVNSSSQVVSASGAIEVVGSTTGTSSVGVLLSNSGTIRSTGTGAEAATIEIVGAGSTEGIDILSAADAVSTVDGAITLTGTASGGIDIRLRIGGGIQSTGSSAVTLVGNSMEVANIAAAANIVTLMPRTAGTEINLGGADAVGVLGLTSAELNQITAGTLIIGDANSGKLTVSNTITRPASTNVELRSSDDIEFLAELNTVGGTLLLSPGASPAAVKPTFDGTDVTASTVSFASNLEITINGTTPGDGTATTYTQLTVVGAVDLNGVDLVFSGSYVPVAGDAFLILDNDGVDAVIGTFNGLPEGERINDFLGSGLDARITYEGGDGNDVVFTVLPPCTTITFTATPINTCGGSDNGQIAITNEAGGVGPYMYSIDDGMTYQSSATFTGLAADTYQVRIKDVNDCETDAEAVVVAAPTCPATGTLTWTGAADTDWSNPCNWDGGCVPAADNEVVIPDVANDPVITTGTAALAKSVNVQLDASLTLETMSSLTLEGASGTPSGGMYNQGTVVNNGHIDIGPSISPGEYGLVNEGMFNNEAGSELSIDRTSNIGLWNKGGTFANDGKIITGAVVGTLRPGIYNEGVFQNNNDGDIEIDRAGGAGFHNLSDGSVANSGKMAFGKTALSSNGIYNFGQFENLADGEIEAERGNTGIFNTTTNDISSSFVNAGKIAIGQTGSINGPAIYNLSALGASASFENSADAEMLLDRASPGIHNGSNCSFENAGLIKIATNAFSSGSSPGIYNRDTFNNLASGEIQVDSISRVGLHHQRGTFSNSGKLLIGINWNPGVSSTGVYNEDIFINHADAELHIDRFSSAGFDGAFNSMTTNAGLIKIGENVLGGNNGLYSGGTFDNEATGEIHVDNITESISTNGIYVTSNRVFTNAGKIVLGEAVGAGSTGLFNNGTFNNSGEIAVDNIRGTFNRHGLYHSNGTFTNTGKIDLGNTGSAGDWGIFSLSTFNNNNGGEITIDRCAISGVRNGSFGSGGTFTNAGKLTIGANASVGDWGLWNDSPFNNSGELNIDNAAVTGLRHQSNTFTNTGKVVLGGIATIGEWGLWNQAAFNNEASGEISIDRSSNTGLLNFLSTFTNEGVITIGANAAVGDQALYNEATFDNDACAVLNIFAPLHNVSTFTNAGLLYANTLAAHTNTGFTNTGIIAYPQGNPIPNVTNDEIIVAPTTSNSCNAISPAFTLGSPVDFDILGVFTDEAGTLSAGTYVTASNTFTPTASLAEDTYNYFVQINDPVGGCTRTVPWSLTTENCAAISGNIVWEHDLSTPVPDATVTLSGDDTGSDDTDANGDYAIPTAGGNSLTLTPTKTTGDAYEGVDAADVTRIQQHVTFIDRLDDGYKVIAADVNLSNSVTGLDAAVVFHAINGNPSAQTIFETPSWRFVDSTHTFMDENAPWPFPEDISLMNVMADVMNQSFVGVKMGDVNGTWAGPVLLTSPPLSLTVQDQVLKAGQTLRIPFHANGLPDVAAWQFALRFDTDYLRFERVLPTAAFPLKDENFGAWQADAGELRSVFAVPQGLVLPKDEVIFELEFQVVYDGLQLSEVLRLDNGILDGRVYNTALNGGAVALAFEAVETRRIASLLPGEAALGFALEQNIPNPFSNETLIRFELPEAGEAVFSVHDVQGRLLYEQRGFLDAGWHDVRLDAAQLGATGVLSYTLRTGAHSATRRMVLVR